MITRLQKEELEKIKPPKYREKVQKHLLNNGHTFSLETIQKVYTGKRNNLIIAKAILSIFNKHRIEQELLKTDIKSVIKKIKKNS